MLDRLTLRLLLAQSADVLTFLAFYLIVGPSIHEERNPLILALMALGGIHLVGIVKLGITLIVIRRYNRPVVITRSWYLPLRTAAISAATASGIVGAAFNLASLINAGGA